MNNLKIEFKIKVMNYVLFLYGYKTRDLKVCLY